MIRGLLKVGTIVAAAIAILAFPAALALDAIAGKDAWLVADGKDPAIVALEKSQWKAEHPDGKAANPREIVDLYGSPLGDAPVRVIAVSSERLVTPSEDPSLTVLRVDKSRENPLQKQTVDFAAMWAAVGAGAAALVGLLVLRLSRKRAPAA